MTTAAAPVLVYTAMINASPGRGQGATAPVGAPTHDTVADPSWSRVVELLRRRSSTPLSFDQVPTADGTAQRARILGDYWDAAIVRVNLDSAEVPPLLTLAEVLTLEATREQDERDAHAAALRLDAEASFEALPEPAKNALAEQAAKWSRTAHGPTRTYGPTFLWASEIEVEAGDWVLVGGMYPTLWGVRRAEPDQADLYPSGWVAQNVERINAAPAVEWGALHVDLSRLPYLENLASIYGPTTRTAELRRILAEFMRSAD